jgi:hypothetical protein
MPVGSQHYTLCSPSFLLLCMWRFCFVTQVRDEDYLRCKKEIVSARYYNIWYCKFQCNSVVYALSRGVYCRVEAPLHVEVPSSDNCSTETVFWPCHGFSLTIKSAVFGVRYALRTRCSCMSMFAEVCAFSFVARSDSMRWVLHNVMCIEMLHYELCACSGTTGDMMTYAVWCLSSFSFSLRSVAQTQTFAGILHNT